MAIDQLHSEARQRLGGRRDDDTTGSANDMRDHSASLDPAPLYRRAYEELQHGDVGAWHRTVALALECPHWTLEQIYQRGFAKLRMGDWSGWIDTETRVFAPTAKSQDIPFARDIRWSSKAWDGVEDLHDKTLFVLNEQGIGDAIQMLRYVPTLVERARRVTLSVVPPLVPVVQCNFGHSVDVRLDGLDMPIDFDRYVWNMSLPALVGSLPPFVPLVSPHERRRLSPDRDISRGGICWAGNPRHPGDAERSISFDILAPFLTRRDVEWHSLQVGDRAAEANACTAVLQPNPPLWSFGDTADLLTELDFVVSVDTAVCHLAGSLGVPTYVLLSLPCDWRWGFGDNTPWYPTARLIRQRRAGDWGGALATLGQLLDARRI